MKILQVNILASDKSTGKITTDIHHVLLRKGHDSLVCYGAGKTMLESDGYYRLCSNKVRQLSVLLRRLHGISYGYYAFFSTKKLIRKIIEYNPDIVHLQCINGCMVDIYRLLRFLGENHIKTICSLHAEFMHTGTCGHAYDCMKFVSEKGCHSCERFWTENHSLVDNTHLSWKLMKRAFSYFSKNDIIISSVSPWLMERAKLSPIMQDLSHTVVLNGINQEVFCKKNISQKIYKVFPSSKKVILYVSARFNLDPGNIKGGYYFVELAKRIPNIMFCVVSSEVSRSERLPDNIYLWGAATSQEELSELYNRADLTVLTSAKETFSMIVAESLSCGTPVVGFCAGGPESITISQYSRFVKYGDLEALQKKVLEMLNEKFNSDEISRNAHQKYSREVMVSNYLYLYNKLLEK